MQLFIDTTGERGQVVAVMRATGAATTRTFVLGGSARGGILLRAAQRALAAVGATVRDVAEVHVVPGPGKFSSIRLGVATANALAWALDVPLRVRKNRVRQAIPEYGAEPTIGVKREA